MSDQEVYDTVWNSPWREKQHVEFEDYLADEFLQGRIRPGKKVGLDVREGKLVIT